MSELSVVPVEPRHSDALVSLFERTGSPCYCRYWHFEGDKNAWLDRCANRPEDSQEELRRALEAGSLSGVVAFAGETLVGWMKLAPAASVPKLFEQRMYKGLPCFSGDRQRAYVIGCFLVDEGWRSRGVADALLRGGLELARSAGARSVEAFPRRVEGVPAEQLWTGPISIFERAGFRVVTELCPYPVLRIELAEAQ